MARISNKLKELLRVEAEMLTIPNPTADNGGLYFLGMIGDAIQDEEEKCGLDIEDPKLRDLKNKIRAEARAEAAKADKAAKKPTVKKMQAARPRTR